MAARSGVARLARLSGAPVIPVAQWGAQDILGRDRKVRLLPRRRIHFLAGPPVDLSQWRASRPGSRAEGDVDADTLRAVTDAIMTRIAEQLAEFRGEPPPV